MCLTHHPVLYLGEIKVCESAHTRYTTDDWLMALDSSKFIELMGIVSAVFIAFGSSKHSNRLSTQN